MKYLFLFFTFVFVANFAAAQDSIYIKKDTVTQNVLIYNAANDDLLEVFNPDKDLRYGGANLVLVKAGGREIYGIRPDEVTKTIIGTAETSFSGTSQALIILLATSFFY